MLEYHDLGAMPYREAWALQDRLREERITGRVGDRVLFVEHPSVFTMGRRDCAEDFFSPMEAIVADGIEVVKTNRGGRVTYHGPGQLVAYFICELASFRMGIKDFVRAIEEACIRLLLEYGIDAGRDPEHPGIWVGRNKIVAVGLNVQHGVTQHGLALNVDCDLRPYRHIVACGIRDRGVTTMKHILVQSPPMGEVKRKMVERFSEVFARPCVAGAER